MSRILFYMACFLLCGIHELQADDYPVSVQEVPLDDDTAAGLITVVTATSPISSHPNTKLLYEAQQSLMRIPALRNCKKIITFDEIRPGREYMREQYEQYKQNVIELTKTDPVFANTELVFCKEWNHLAGTVREGVHYVKTPYVFMHQHDLVLEKDFDLNGALATMMVNPNIKYVHLWGCKNSDQWYNGPVDNKVEGIHYIPLCRSFGWSDQCNIASTDYYRYFVLPQCHYCFMERVMHPGLWKSMEIHGMDEGHRIFGTYLYGDLNDGNFIRHTDGAHN